MPTCSTSCATTADAWSACPTRDADGFAHGLFALEQNWRGPLLANGSVETTLEQFRTLERRVSPRVLANWRFQQALYRAYYDALRAQPPDLRDRPRRAGDRPAAPGRRERLARRRWTRPRPILDRAVTEPVAADLRARVFELAEALFQSIRMQLSVPRYKAIAWAAAPTSTRSTRS